MIIGGGCCIFPSHTKLIELTSAQFLSKQNFYHTFFLFSCCIFKTTKKFEFCHAYAHVAIKCIRPIGLFPDVSPFLGHQCEAIVSLFRDLMAVDVVVVVADNVAFYFTFIFYFASADKKESAALCFGCAIKLIRICILNRNII